MRSDNRMLTLVADGRYEDSPGSGRACRAGRIGTRQLLEDERVLELGAQVHERLAIHDLGLHGLAGARRGRAARRPRGDHALDGDGLAR